MTRMLGECEFLGQRVAGARETAESDVELRRDQAAEVTQPGGRVALGCTQRLTDELGGCRRLAGLSEQAARSFEVRLDSLVRLAARPELPGERDQCREGASRIASVALQSRLGEPYRGRLGLLVSRLEKHPGGREVSTGRFGLPL